MDRSEVIDWLVRLKSSLIWNMVFQEYRNQYEESLNYAINSLKVDKQYQLEYEELIKDTKTEINKLPILADIEITHGLLEDAVALDRVLEIIDKAIKGNANETDN